MAGPDIVQTAENLQKAHVELKRYGECSKTNVASGTHLAAPRSRGLKIRWQHIEYHAVLSGERGRNGTLYRGHGISPTRRCAI